jgi:anti-sigma factor RsiW
MIEDRCKDVVEALGDLDALPNADRALVASHLDRCPHCRALQAGLSSLPAMVRAAIDGTIDAAASHELAEEALGALIATADARVRDALRRSLTLEDMEALVSTEARKKA